MPADPMRVREKLIRGIDKALEWPRLSGLDGEGKAYLRACRAVISEDDAVVAKIAGKVGPYDSPVEDGQMKKMTAEDMKAVDWAALFLLAPEAFALFKKVLDAFHLMESKGPTARCPCPTELREACDAECEALTGLIVAHCKVHQLIAGDD